jgi:signal transduction histidine kinase/phage shock protein PspC (stress-responsive transcriptional regulator)
MATASRHPRATARRAPHRDPAHGVLAGVCAGLAREVGVDPLVVRVIFVALATAGGIGIGLYALAWAVMPAGGEREGEPVLRRAMGRRGSVEVALGAALLLLSVLLALRATGIWFSDPVVWPAVLLAAGGALLWRQSQLATGARELPPSAPVAAPAEAETARETRAAVVSRSGLGIALVIAAGFVFLEATGSLSAARDVVLAALVVAIVLGVIFAPWIVRLARSLSEERASRIRSQERAEMAAHLHDSVLQTLALVQQRAEDPRAVAALARRQERELRGWLAGRTAQDGDQRLAAALEAVAGEVEHAHGVTVEVVVTGDRVVDERGRALVAATREAIVNAAKFGGGSPVSVFADASGDELQVFVRDRGPGFDPGAVPADRRGVRESIVGRMARHGGRAAVHSTPGAGTEVELTLPGAPE